jgi:hypothetical protein
MSRILSLLRRKGEERKGNSIVRHLGIWFLHAKGWDRLSDRQCLMHVRLPVHMQVLRAHMR